MKIDNLAQLIREKLPAADVSTDKNSGSWFGFIEIKLYSHHLIIEVTSDLRYGVSRLPQYPWPPPFEGPDAVYSNITDLMIGIDELIYGEDIELLEYPCNCKTCREDYEASINEEV